MKTYYVYILSNTSNSTIYVGVTNNLARRVWEHKNHFVESFTKKYNVTKLIYYELFDNIFSALTREKQLKGWTRIKKDQLINAINPNWDELTL